MKRIALIFLVALTACTAEAPLSLRMVCSEMARNPEASYLDGQEGNLKWNYTTGLELKAFLDVYCHDVYGHDVYSHDEYSHDEYCHSERSEESLLSYVDAWYDAIIDTAGVIRKYKKENYSLDHICPGRTLFRLYDLTGREKYRATMDTLYNQLLSQPRTPEGGFWHKAIYPEQMWLDGLYMAEPFYTEYTLRYVTDSTERAANLADIVRQFVTVYDHTFDPATGLLRHAWDSSHAMFWCDPRTGQSAHAWGRALGWYCMGLVDVIEQFPEGEEKDTLVRLLTDQLRVLPRYADAATGLWYQVLDSPEREGNYLEATCNAMFAYVYLKSARLGLYGDRETARRLFESLTDTFVTEEDGLLQLNDCCEVAGLGGKNNRSGDFAYYIHEPVRANDPKGIGPFIWAALEYELL